MPSPTSVLFGRRDQHHRVSISHHHGATGLLGHMAAFDGQQASTHLNLYGVFHRRFPYASGVRFGSRQEVRSDRGKSKI